MNESTDNSSLLERIETNLTWNDLHLSKSAYRQIKELEAELNNSNSLFNKIESKTRKGLSVLFTGESGTTKTLAAELLGKYTSKDVYRVNLSLVVSKYIGETEQNLSRLFDDASNNWILFFDEADALFGKRTEVKEAHDRYVNIEISYLLERIEKYPGLVILSVNSRENVDEAFLRRIHSIINFNPQSFIERKPLQLRKYLNFFKLKIISKPK